MKNLLKFPLIILCVLLVGSCSESLEELNIDPNNPTDVELKLLLPEILSSSTFNEGTNPNRIAGIIMQQFLGLDAQQLAYNRYVLGEDVMNNYWLTGLYAGPLRSCKVIIEKAEDEADPRPIYAAIAKIVMANEYGKATSFFGDIPLTEALQGTDNLKPAYDSQESVYNAIQAMLDDAISTLNGLGTGGYSGGDLIFDGDAASWAKAAHAMKARYFMHVSKRTGDYAQAVSEATQAMESNADNPSFQYEVSITANHSLAKFGIDRPSTLGINPNFAAMMDGDPRQAKYMYSDDGENWLYFDSAEGGQMFWAQSDALVPMITYTEMLFIQAEAMARSGGDASSLLADAITSNFELIGLTADDATGYIDGLADASLETVMTEAYKAYYGFNFHETWANWRRTGIPSLSPVADGGGGLNPSGAIPQRFLYVESETQTNFDNVSAARDRQGGGLLDAPVWAFQ